MNIVFLTRRFYPLVGGVEKHCLLLGQELLKRGHQLTVITEWDYREINKEDPKASFLAEETYKGIRIVRIPVRSSEKLKKWHIWSWVIKNREEFKRADIVHCHDVFYWTLPLGIRRNTYVTFHGYEGICAPNLKKILSHQIAASLSRGNLCIGDFHKKWYGVKPDFVSYGAVEKPKYRVDRQKKQYDLCYSGRLASDVGILVYLEALRLLKERGMNYSMVVCGSGPLLLKAKDFARREKLKVTFLGFTDEAVAKLAESRVGLISRYLGILEALVMEIPVVATYNNEIKKDYLGMAPFSQWIEIVNQPESVVEAILRLMQGKNDSSKQVEARKWAENQTWARMTELYLQLWHSS